MNEINNQKNLAMLRTVTTIADFLTQTQIEEPRVECNHPFSNNQLLGPGYSFRIK